MLILLPQKSQGAQVVHLGAALLPAATAAKVKAAVLFGDPKRGQPLQAISADKVVTYCFETDLICDGAPIVLPSHLSYSVFGISAAKFVVSKLS
jgi:cutinase